MLISMAVWVQVSKKSTACKTLITHLNFEYKLKIPLWLVEDWQTGIDQETSPRWVKWSLIQQLNNYEVLVANGKWVVYTQWACSDEVAIVLWNQLDILSFSFGINPERPTGFWSSFQFIQCESSYCVLILLSFKVMGNDRWKNKYIVIMIGNWHSKI
jgi:hypothetical protein